jgi:hypothetical protein
MALSIQLLVDSDYLYASFHPGVSPLPPSAEQITPRGERKGEDAGWRWPAECPLPLEGLEPCLLHRGYPEMMGDALPVLMQWMHFVS